MKIIAQARLSNASKGINKTGNEWARCTVFSDNDYLNHTFWTVGTVIDKINQLKIQKGDLIELVLDVNSSSGRAFINLLDIEVPE